MLRAVYFLCCFIFGEVYLPACASYVIFFLLKIFENIEKHKILKTPMTSTPLPELVFLKCCNIKYAFLLSLVS